MCALIVHFHHLIRTEHLLAEERLKKALLEGEAIKGMKLQPLIILAWKHDQGEASHLHS